MEVKSKNVLITGVAGYLGTSLLKHLLEDRSIGRIVGTDISKPKIRSNRFVFEHVDARDEKGHAEIMAKYDVSIVFHFAFMLGEVKDQKKAISVNIGGTRSIMKAANQVKSVKRIIFAGSVSAYGANKGNKLYMKESHPLRARTLKYGINKMLFEKEIARLKAELRPDLGVVVLRICTIVGPTEREGGAVEAFLSLPCGLHIIGHKCPIQFVHEEDLLDVFDKVIADEHVLGVYNVAPKDYTSIEQISRKMKKPILYLPYSLLYLAFFVLYRVKPSIGISENSVSYLAYPIIVDSTKLENELGKVFKYSSLGAFLDCARQLSKKKKGR